MSERCIARLTATKAIRELNQSDAGTIPIIAMTAHLAKPLDIEKVKKIIYEQTKNGK